MYTCQFGNCKFKSEDRSAMQEHVENVHGGSNNSYLHSDIEIPGIADMPVGEDDVSGGGGDFGGGGSSGDF